MIGPVHFFLTRGKLRWQYRRALETARVHEAPIILWHQGEIGDAPDGVEARRLDVPSWLENAHASTIYDVSALKTLYEHGGMALGLDSISLRPAFDLLGDAEAMCGSDVPFVDGRYMSELGHEVADPFNNHLIARVGSAVVGEMLEEAWKRVVDADQRWGATGPLLLTEFACSGRLAVAPFPALCGWEGSYIWRFYQGEQPTPDVRVVHLFSSAYPAEFSRFQWSSDTRTKVGV